MARRDSSATSSRCSCTLTAATPLASASSTRFRVRAASSYLSRLAITGTRPRLAPPSIADTGCFAALPAMSHSAMSTAASALSTVPARPKLAKRLRAAEVQRLAVRDRLAEIVRDDCVADRGEQRALHRRTQRQAFAVARQAVAGRDPRERQAQRVAAGPRNAQRDGFDAVDDHARSTLPLPL
jgi:hypothetical protein